MNKILPVLAVLTYKNNGSKKAYGQVVGADGSGEYAVVFYAESNEKAEESARAYAKVVKAGSEYEGHISEVHIVCGDGSKIVRINNNVPS